MKKNISMPHLGGLTPAVFLRDYWQKKPLLIRAAFPNFVAPLTRAEVLTLAAREECESRLIVRDGRDWRVTPGPISARARKAVANSSWTILAQDTQHHAYEAHALLAKFNFISQARIDDLMVSVAVKGAGVGPHVDSYDVFLLQGEGQRRWQISTQSDLSLQPNQPLKLLKRFKPEQEWVLDTGDMLYLPPHVAHNGVAQTDCMTWSIGFRAPSQQDLATGLLDFLRDELALDGAYRDPDLHPVAHSGEIDAAMRARMEKMLAPVAAAARERALIARFLGCHLTEPKAHVYFEPPDEALTQKMFQRAAAAMGVALDLRTRFLYDRRTFFVNGTTLPVEACAVRALKRLADARHLPASAITASTVAPLYSLYLAGFLHLA
jgi:50S ribosomal protein L16 3-hydroxylase